MADSLTDLAHDHHEINRQVLAVAASLRDLTPDAEAFVTFTGALADLQELLFSHFAVEEEGLFPFLAETFPQLATRVHDMIVAHDTICGALTRTRYLTPTAGNLAAIHTLYERFEVAYANHAASELALLTDLDARLSSEQRVTLTGLIHGL